MKTCKMLFQICSLLSFCQKILRQPQAAMLFTNGTVAEGKWSREDLDSPTIFTDKEGKEFKLNVGTTWIQVVDDNTEISYK